MLSMSRPTRTGRRKRRRHWSSFLLNGSVSVLHYLLIVAAILLFGIPYSAEATTEYFMDGRYCNTKGFIDIPTRSSITVRLRNPTGPRSTFQNCKMAFRASNDRDYLKIRFDQYYITECSVALFVNQARYDCKQAKPHEESLEERSVTLHLNRDLNTQMYNAIIVLTTYQDIPVIRNDSVSNPTMIGLIVGTVCGIILLILIIAIIASCYYQKKKMQLKRRKGVLDELEQSNVDSCYINDSDKNGTIIKNNSSPKNKEKSLLSSDEFQQRDIEQFYDYVEDNNTVKAPVINTLATSPSKTAEFDFDPSKLEASNKTPKSPMLSALHSSPRFQASYKTTEEEAEERVKRISQTSTSSQPPPTPPPLPPVPTSPQVLRSQTGPTYAGIHRGPRVSVSSDEIEHLERELRNETDNTDPGIKIIKDLEPVPSSEIVPIQVQAKQLKQPVQEAPVALPQREVNPSQHTLRPTRNRGPVEKEKQQTETANNHPVPLKPQKVTKEKSSKKDSGLSSLRKRGQKSRPLFKGRGLASEVEDESVYGDEELQRAETPVSIMGTRSTRADDIDGFSLRRTASKQSLFASRTSLYGRRGKRERRSSITDSLTSYAHDDIDMYIPSVQPVTMSKQDARAFKSLGDIASSSAAKEIARQILQESSTQMGKSSATSVSHKKYIPKKSTSSQKSSMSTQTIEQKGTQTELASKKINLPPNKTPSVGSNVSSSISTKPPSKFRRDNINTMLPAIKPPVSLSRSQFQPISNARDIESSISANSPYLDEDPMPGQLPETDPRSMKSPWELLCELTDTEMKMRNNSLPSENAPSMVNSSTGEGYQPSLARAGMAHLPETYAPSVSSQVSNQGPYIPTYPPSNASASYTPSVISEPSYKQPLPSNIGNLYTRKSSWEALKELTDNKLSYNPQETSESIV